MKRPRRLLSLGHSYVVAANRRLAHEMSRVGNGAWEVTAAAPEYFHGGNDLRPNYLESLAGEPCPLVAVAAHLTSRVHIFAYGRHLQTLLRSSWDLVHCWEEPYILAGAQVAWWLPRGTSLVYFTCQNNSKRYPPPFNWLERYSMGRASGWIGCGTTVVQALSSRRAYGNLPVRFIPLGVDLHAFRADPAASSVVRRELGWKVDGPPVVGYLGRFTVEKGIKLLTGVLDGLATPWRALFVGEGKMEEYLRRWGSGHGDRVRVCTGVRHAQVSRYLNAMNILCAPSQTTPRWREQFGRMLIEGFACGVPVVGSDSGEIPHVIGDAGLVVEETDAAGWHTALGCLLDNPERRSELGARGHERAHARYAWPVVARQYLDFFEEVLGRPREGRH
jgi:glycosyltransferase involved in cell wall biosynthesis